MYRGRLELMREIVYDGGVLCGNEDAGENDSSTSGVPVRSYASIPRGVQDVPTAQQGKDASVPDSKSSAESKSSAYRDSSSSSGGDSSGSSIPSARGGEQSVSPRSYQGGLDTSCKAGSLQPSWEKGRAHESDVCGVVAGVGWIQDPNANTRSSLPWRGKRVHCQGTIVFYYSFCPTCLGAEA